MFQGLAKAALTTAAAVAFMALAATPSPAFTLSAPSLEKPTAASNIEQAYWVRGWGWRHPWGWGWGYGYRPWGWGYGYRPWGWGYGYRPWGWGYGWRPWGYGYGWRRPWGYRWG
jgi:hypothetical protein